MILELHWFGIDFRFLNLIFAVVSAPSSSDTVQGIVQLVQGIIGIIAAFVMIYWVRNAPPPSTVPKPPIRRSIKILMIVTAALVLLFSVVAHFSPPPQH